MRRPVINNFDRDLTALLPGLRKYALSLIHDRDRADDLVQETAEKALTGRASFRPGTNFAAWLYRIERNAFISGLRRAHPTVSLDNVDSGKLSCRPHQESAVAMREFAGAFRRLSDDGRRTLLLGVVEGQCYKQIAKRCGVSVGTVKSRTFRARAALVQMLGGKPGVDDRGREDAPAVQRPTARPPCSSGRPAIVTPPEIELTRRGDSVLVNMPCARTHGGTGRDDRPALWHQQYALTGLQKVAAGTELPALCAGIPTRPRLKRAPPSQGLQRT